MARDPNLNRVAARQVRRVGPPTAVVTAAPGIARYSPPTLPRDPNNEHPPMPEPPTGNHDVKNLSRSETDPEEDKKDPDAFKEGEEGPVSKAADEDDKDKKGTPASGPDNKKDDDDDGDGSSNT